MPAGPNKVNWFISHFWGTSFRHFVFSIRKHAESVAVVNNYAALNARASWSLCVSTVLQPQFTSLLVNGLLWRLRTKPRGREARRGRDNDYAYLRPPIIHGSSRPETLFRLRSMSMFRSLTSWPYQPCFMTSSDFFCKSRCLTTCNSPMSWLRHWSVAVFLSGGLESSNQKDMGELGQLFGVGCGVHQEVCINSGV